MNIDILTMQPGGQPIAQSLGYALAAVVVDNYTQDYVRLPDANRDVPPYSFGVVVPLSGGGTARAKLVATSPAVINGPPMPRNEAVLTWTDQALTPSSGVTLADSVSSQQANLLTQGQTTSTSGSVQVPSGTQSLSAILVNGAAGGSSFLKLVGHSSGLLLGLLFAGPVNGPARDVFGIDSVVDTQVDWTLTVGSGTASSSINALPTAPPFPPKPLSDFPLHSNGAVTAAASYSVWKINHDATNPRALRIHGWSLSFDGAATANCFASLNGVNAVFQSAPTSNSAELWNRQLVNAGGTALADVVSEVDFGDRPLMVNAADPTTQDMTLQWQAPVAASSYNVRGTIQVSVVPWTPGLGVAVV